MGARRGIIFLSLIWYKYKSMFTQIDSFITNKTRDRRRQNLIFFCERLYLQNWCLVISLGSAATKHHLKKKEKIKIKLERAKTEKVETLSLEDSVCGYFNAICEKEIQFCERPFSPKKRKKHSKYGKKNRRIREKPFQKTEIKTEKSDSEWFGVK